MRDVGRIKCTRKLRFDAAHRVMNHESKCATLHGHGYEALITATSDKLDSIGRIIDFSVIKEKVGDWIDKYWDHNVLVNNEDTCVIEALNSIPRKKDPFICCFNPTAENIAHYLLTTVCPKVLQDSYVKVIRVRIYETPNCFADAEL